jgi:hypothetical protein
MPSEEQIAANRRNALQSTGPNTPQGKAIVSRDRLIHGLTAKRLDGEEPLDLYQLFETLKAELQPLDSIDEILVERSATADWRLSRFPQIEAGIFRCGATEPLNLSELTNDSDPLGRPGQDPQAAAFIWDATGRDCFRKLARYESGLEREFDRVLRLPERRRAQTTCYGKPARSLSSRHEK